MSLLSRARARSAIEKAGVRAYVALHEAGGSPKYLPKAAFSYDAERNLYVCPRGSRPPYTVRRAYKWTYLYAAEEPTTG
ncbi:MAG: hypothetical protein AVDCRST_MAG02-1672 [uncultured Rubrobacteraceae bacterium]|uniref:Uncharacterized protein n=1 Tax=uncultured Rubrobacteraceae bacterium TaxID=349277 RepID=A0A6J4R3W6_9ACTN|nr:MAG: hypothetical protein AVDCRST_MAG02-1672 [uncultured Rubrobacteraceae bacterium]